jgi:hypothetical protein
MPANSEKAPDKLIVKHNISDSFHLDYFSLAVESCFACQQELQKKWYLPRHVVDTIIYSYTCIDASIEYIYRSAEKGQFPSLKIPDTWGARFLARKWGNLSLNDKIGMMTYAWKNQEFWGNEGQFYLFLNLETIRDKLIHLEIYRLIHTEEITNQNKEVRHISIDIATKDFLINRSRTVAQFHNNLSRARLIPHPRLRFIPHFFWVNL